MDSIHNSCNVLDGRYVGVKAKLVSVILSPFLEPFTLYFFTCLTTFSILTWETVLWLFQSHQFCHHRRGVGVVHIIASWGGFCGWDLKFGKTVVQGVPPCVTRGVLWVSFAVKRLR